MISVTIDSPNLDIGPQWHDLIQRASSNVFMNPVALKAACETNFARIVMWLAWEQGAGQRKLVGVWALQLRRVAPVVAAQVLMYCGATAYTWKTAFSAKYGKYSPGALLIDRITDELFAGPDTLAINSCAAEGSFMAYLWAGRRTMVDMLVDIGPGKSLVYRMEAGRQLGYRRLRSLRDWLRNRPSAPPPKKLGMASPQ